MTTALTLDLFRPSILDPQAEDAAPMTRALRAASGPAPARARRTPDGGLEPSGGPTLDAVLVGAWEGLTAHRTVACPACGASMAPRYGAGPTPVGGRCGSCRTTMS